MEDKRDVCPLGEPTCRCPVRPGPAPPPRYAPRRLDPPAVCSGVGLDWMNCLSDPLAFQEQLSWTVRRKLDLGNPV